MKKQLLTIGLLSILGFNSSVQGQSYVNKKILHTNGSPSLIVFNETNNLAGKSTNSLFSELLSISSDTEMKLESSQIDKSSKFKDDKYQMYFQGIKVEGGVYNLHYKNAKLTSMNGEVFNTDDANKNASYPIYSAFENAKKSINAEKYMWEDAEYSKMSGYTKPAGETVFLPIPTADGNYKLLLAYKFDIYAAQPISRGYVYVDATNGRILAYDAIMKHAKINGNFPTNSIPVAQVIEINAPVESPVFALGTAATRYSGSRQIETSLSGTDYVLKDTTRGSGVYTYNSKKTTSLTTTNFTDNDNNWTAAEFDNSTFDNAALDAHWGVSKTYDYFKETFNRNSYNNTGGLLKSYIHYGSNYENAGWTGNEMIYGDGASTFRPLTAFDVTAHELGHGVCEYSANLKYERESGALNEGFSDIWGAIIEHKYAPEKQAFLIGEDITKASPGYLRSMNNPKTGLSAQPDTYKGINWKAATVEEGCITPGQATNDYCGVHYNSGVLNHWFYILVMGKTGTNDLGKSYNVTGIGWDKAEKIVYKLETTYLTANSNYKNTRDYGIIVAQELYGVDSPEAIATQDAFYAVGVGSKYLSTPDTTPPSIPLNLTASNVKGTTATLTWGASTDNTEMEGYIVYRGATEIGRTTTALTYNVTGLALSTTYNFTVKAVDTYNNISEASNVATITTTDQVPYCASKGNSTADEKIGRVQLNTIDNTSTGAAGYEDFTNISTDLTLNKQYTITITPKWTSSSYTEGYAVFIDWNADGDFADTGETVFTKAASTTTPAVGTFTVPATANITKPTVMRVSMKFGGVPTSCEAFSYGQVEDYTIVAKQNLATAENAVNKNISIYPNPVKDVLNIQSKKLGDFSYQIFNTAGQAVQQGKANGHNINVQSLPLGNYVLKITSNEETTTLKFIKK